MSRNLFSGLFNDYEYEDEDNRVPTEPTPEQRTHAVHIRSRLEESRRQRREEQNRIESRYVTGSIFALQRAIDENKFMTISNIAEDEIFKKVKKLRNNPNLNIVRDFLKNFIETNDIRKRPSQTIYDWARYTDIALEPHIVTNINQTEALEREARSIEDEHIRSVRVIRSIIDIINGGYIQDDDYSVSQQAESIYRALVDGGLVEPPPPMSSNMRRPGRSIRRAPKEEHQALKISI